MCLETWGTTKSFEYRNNDFCDTDTQTPHHYIYINIKHFVEVSLAPTHVSPSVILSNQPTNQRTDILSKVYLSKVCFCEIYPTYVSYKLCKFISQGRAGLVSEESRLVLDHCTDTMRVYQVSLIGSAGVRIWVQAQQLLLEFNLPFLQQQKIGALIAGRPKWIIPILRRVYKCNILEYQAINLQDQIEGPTFAYQNIRILGDK